jgi:membrane fusion protein (multidrug efflux system)
VGLRRLAWVTGLCLLAALAILLARRQPDGSAAAPSSAERPIPVVAALVEQGELSERIEALGTARANESVTITARVTETVRALRFDDGQAVEQGEVIAELVSAEEAAALASAEATLADATKQYDRVAQLVRERTESQARLDRVLAERDAARARVQELEARLSDRLVRAPFSGVLGLRRVSPGALVEPGDAITTLDDVDPMKLDFTVPERLLGEVQAEQEVRATSVAYPGRVFGGRISAVDTRINPRTRAVTLRALVDNPDRLLRPGMLLSVELLHGRRQALMIPESALVPIGNQAFVYRVTPELRVERVSVRTGARRPGRIEIVEGLSAGQRVVVEGTQHVSAGAAVELIQPEPVDVDL